VLRLRLAKLGHPIAEVRVAATRLRFKKRASLEEKKHRGWRPWWWKWHDVMGNEMLQKKKTKVSASGQA